MRLRLTRGRIGVSPQRGCGFRARIGSASQRNACFSLPCAELKRSPAVEFVVVALNQTFTETRYEADRFLLGASTSPTNHLPG